MASLKECDCTARSDEEMKRIKNEYDPDQLAIYWVMWGRSINANDSEYYVRVCSECERKLKGESWVKKHKVAEWIHLSRVPTIQDLHIDVFCSYDGCGSRGHEYHHWAPKEIFGKKEAEKWPIDPLCKAHHDMWHDAMTIGFHDESDYKLVYGKPVRRHARPSLRS